MAKITRPRTAISQIASYDESGDLNVMIETARGSRNKFKYDEAMGVFRLSKALPSGQEFPYDFGFVPGTHGEDGDPLDVLVLMDAPAFAGCLVVARLIGVIKAEQSEEDGKTVRNDRLIAVAAESYTHRGIQSLQELNPNLLDELEHFFRSYNEMYGKQFKPLGRAGPISAKRILDEGRAPAQRKTKRR